MKADSTHSYKAATLQPKPMITGGSSGGFAIPKDLEFLDEEDERRKCQDFKDHLIKF